MENEKLLETVIKSRLEDSLDDAMDLKERGLAFKEAMEAMDRHIELKRLDSTNKENELVHAENELARKEQELNRIVKYVEIVAVPVGLFILDSAFKWKYMKTICNFEKDYTFTTSPGRSLSGLFRFKK